MAKCRHRHLKLFINTFSLTRWRFWAFWSPTSTIFWHKRRANQHSFIVTNFKSPTSLQRFYCGYNSAIGPNSTTQYMTRYSRKIGSPARHLDCTRPKFGERYPVEGIKMLGILPYAHLLCHWSSIHSHKTVKVPVKVLIKHSINRLLSSLVNRWYVLF